MVGWKTVAVAAGLLSVCAGHSFGGILPDGVSVPVRIETVQARRSCKSVVSCREAVILWCSGYRRADGDGDGIPCENVCPNKELVDRIRKEIGC